MVTDAAGFERALSVHGDDVSGTGLERTDGVLLFRLQVLRRPYPSKEPVRALLNMVHDGPLDEDLAELFRCTDAWLPQLLERHCAPGTSTLDLRAWLQARAYEEDTVYLGFPGLTVAQLRAEARLRNVVQDFLDTLAGDSAAPENIRLAIREHVLSLRDPALPSGPRPPVSFEARVRQKLDLFWQVLSPFSGLLRGEIRRWLLPAGAATPQPQRALREALLALHWLWTIIPSSLFLAVIRRLEATEATVSVTASAQLIDDLERREDHQIHNPMTMFSSVRPRLLRRWALQRILKGAEAASRHLWNQGKLAGIDTIHAARFLQIDEGRRMLFISDYDGSWGRYLGDFLGPGKVAVVPIWTHLLGCPPTRGLFEPTPRFEPRFLAFTRHDQVPVQLWYSAFPKLSLANIHANSRLRDGLFAPELTSADARTWLEDL